jgi:hypothetical protein
MSVDSLSPLRFEPSMEVAAADEDATIAGLIETMGSISRTTFEHSGHAIRSVHAKSHGLLRGELTVLDGLPPILAQGLFAKPGRYDAVMRFSTIPGDILDDSVSTPRGLAVKLIGVDGARLPGSEGDTTQDFVMINGPAFGAPTPQKFLGLLKLIAATTDRAPELKKVLSSVARVTEAVIEAFGGKSGAVILLGGHKETNILGETFYSQTPFLYGDYIAKFSLAPLGGLALLTDKPIDAKADPNALRNAVRQHFAVMGGEWELRVQLCTDLASMPIEDASVVWPEDKSPYVPVARLRAAPQDTWSDAYIAEIDDGMAFSTWHGLAAHRPLGAVNRARQATYASSAKFRGSHNGCPMHEPTTGSTAVTETPVSG